MNLSFSTNRWESYGFDDFIRIAREYKFNGIEIHDIDAVKLRNEFQPERLSGVQHKLRNHNLCISCLDVVADIASAPEKAFPELMRCLETARRLHVPYIRLKTAGTAPADDEAARKFIGDALPFAEQARVVLLVETVGCYADTAKLGDMLAGFVTDNVAALWDLHYPYRVCGETPETTVKNLGAYIRHIHLKDSESAEVHAIVGEGSLPLDRVMNALHSVNYDGFISIEWDPKWEAEISSPDVIFAQFVSYMSRFELARSKTVLHENKRHTGKFIWKKDILIEKTFSQVLDAMVREFPDQYAFKYTTLDYTRTYSEFRDDVDNFARALIALGVKPGAKVAIWATNVPQWYITFWATTKIGAALVTVNTAYKIQEAEYLLRQSDTHTLVMISGYRDSDYAGIVNELCHELAQTRPGEPLHAKRLPFLRNVISVGFRQPGSLTWEEAVEYAHKVPMEELLRRAAAVDIHDVCNMQYTSGTTGFPKGVMLTHSNVVNNGKCIGDSMDLSTADRMMVQVPMFHCFGMVLAMTASMTHGTTLCPLPYFS
ncbi:MAG: AMP-binding protein, partial [Lentisphaeria bacterium]|nr:AMP-binding protein [Lentisphaeria bacterium]